MAFEIACPGCQGAVELSDDPLAEQTCPHCQAVFRLQAVLVETASEQTSAEEFLAAVSAAEAQQAASSAEEGEAETFASDTAEEALAEEPAEPTEATASEEPAFGDVMAALAGQEAEASPEDHPPGLEEAPAGADFPQHEQTEPEQGTILLGEQEEEPDQQAEEPAEPEDYWASLEGAAPDTDEEPESLTEKARSLSRRQGPSPLVHLLGIIGSGFLGLALGYYVLNYVGGPRFNFLNIPLPGIPHTQQNDIPEEAP